MKSKQKRNPTMQYLQLKAFRKSRFLEDDRVCREGNIVEVVWGENRRQKLFHPKITYDTEKLGSSAFIWQN